MLARCLILRDMWRYSLFEDRMDTSEGDLENWWAALAADGWQLWDAALTLRSSRRARCTAPQSEAQPGRSPRHERAEVKGLAAARRHCSS